MMIDRVLPTKGRRKRRKRRRHPRGRFSRVAGTKPWTKVCFAFLASRLIVSTQGANEKPELATALVSPPS